MKAERFLIALLAFLVLCAGWYGYSRYEATRAQSSFLEAMQQAQVNEQVSIGGVSYDVQGQTVTSASSSEQVEGGAALPALRLAYAKAAAERSPFMALPNIDLSEINTYIEQLADTEVQLASIQSTSSDAALVHSSLYPISFLQAESSAEAARRAFIESGSDTDEAAYEHAQTEAVNAYQSDIASFSSAFQQIVPADAGEYADAAYIITPAQTLNELRSLAEGNAGIASQIQDRDACIAGDLNVCDLSALQFATTTAPAPQTITPDQEQLAQQIYAIWKQLAKPGTLTTQQIDLSNSACTSSLEGANRFILLFSGGSLYRLNYLGNIRFVKTSDESQTGFGVFMASDGLSYEYDSPITHYTCAALENDLADLFSVYDIATLARTTPISTYATGAEAGQLKALETSLAKGNVISESDAVAYLVDSMQASTSAPSNVSNTLDSLYLERLDGDAGEPRFMYNIASIESANVLLYKQNIPIALGAEYLFYIRSAFLGLFMSNNPSIVGQQSVPFPPNTVPISQQPYVLFSQLDTAERTQAVNDLYTFIQLHENAASQVDF